MMVAVAATGLPLAACVTVTVQTTSGVSEVVALHATPVSQRQKPVSRLFEDTVADWSRLLAVVETTTELWAGDVLVSKFTPLTVTPVESGAVLSMATLAAA